MGLETVPFLGARKVRIFDGGSTFLGLEKSNFVLSTIRREEGGETQKSVYQEWHDKILPIENVDRVGPLVSWSLRVWGKDSSDLP